MAGSQELQKFSFDVIKIQEFEQCTEAAITLLGAHYLTLTVKGIDDKEGLEAVHKARMDMVKRRNAVTKAGKAGRDDANKYAKQVKQLEDKIVSWMAPIEAHLVEQEQVIENERRRLAEEAVQKELARIQARKDRIFAYGGTLNGAGNFLIAGVMIPTMVVENSGDEQFDAICIEIEQAKEAELVRLEEEAQVKAAEAERARIEQEAADEERRKLEEERAALQAERDRLEQIAREQALRQKEIDDEAQAVLQKQTEDALVDHSEPEPAPVEIIETLPDCIFRTVLPPPVFQSTPPPPPPVFRSTPPPPQPADRPADPAMHEYAFDVLLAAVIRITAHSQTGARDYLRTLDSVTLEELPDFGCKITEFSVQQIDAKAFEIDGLEVKEEAI
ncbi:MAG: hypothetical protein AB9866_21560 [Syntrophobacteraceae bacterium]